MHPVIRLFCFILLVAGLAMGSKAVFLFMLTLLPLFFLLFKHYDSFSSVWLFLKRLRWLFLSLLILNLWLNTPTFTWLPEFSGLLLALERIVALILIVLAAHLLLTTTETHDIIAAWLWWLLPLNKIGFSTERLAVRFSLVLDTVQAVQKLELDSPPTTTTTNPIKKISEKVAGLFTQVISHAETTPLRLIEIPQNQSPPLWQWVYPLFILVLVLF